MSITFGVMLHMDRAPAAPVVPHIPLQQPVIEATVVAETVNPVLPPESASQGQFNAFNMARQKPPPPMPLQTYNLRGEQRLGGGQSGMILDIFA